MAGPIRVSGMGLASMRPPGPDQQIDNSRSSRAPTTTEAGSRWRSGRSGLIPIYARDRTLILLRSFFQARLFRFSEKAGPAGPGRRHGSRPGRESATANADFRGATGGNLSPYSAQNYPRS